MTRASASRGSPPTPERFRLTGPTATLDPATQAFRRDVADIALADRLFAPHYAAPMAMLCSRSTQLLEEPEGRPLAPIAEGGGFAMLDTAGGWAWGYTIAGHRVGYVIADALVPA